MAKEAEESAISVDIAIAGKGLSAQVAALALVDAGFSVALEQPVSNSGRGALVSGDVAMDDWQAVVALSPDIKHMLATLGAMPDHFGRIDEMAIDVRRTQADAPIRPDLIFHSLAPPDENTADDQDGDRVALAHIYSMSELTRCIVTAVERSENISFIKNPIERFGNGAVTLSDGCRVSALVCLDAAGRSSVLRDRAGINVLRGDYAQDAIVCWLKQTQPHHNIARQFFTPYGPLALLPLPSSHDVALVWSQQRARAHALISTSLEIFHHCLEEVVGIKTIKEIGPRQSTPLGYLLAEHFYQDGLILIGEAAHVVHPLAGQGLNLTCRDIALLVDTLKEARHLGLGIRAETLLLGYAQQRHADAAATLGLTHLLKQAFRPSSSQAVLAQAMRSFGGLIQDVPGLTKFFQEQAAKGLGARASLFAPHTSAD